MLTHAKSKADYDGESERETKRGGDNELGMEFGRLVSR